jgi:hypothetical protein
MGEEDLRHKPMLGILLAGATTPPAPLPAGTELVRIVRSSDGSRLTVDLRRRQKVTCFDADGPYSAACRVIRGRLCCETGGWLPPPYNRVEEEITIRAVIDCRTGRFDRRGDGRGWQPLGQDAALQAIAAQHCPASHP